MGVGRGEHEQTIVGASEFILVQLCWTLYKLPDVVYAKVILDIYCYQ